MIMATPAPDEPMDDSLDPVVHRRLTVAVCWALARRACLDSRELFEDSFALNEEFREWLVCLEDHPDRLPASVLMVPKLADLDRQREGDELLES
jgi:hypothetical protein